MELKEIQKYVKEHLSEKRYNHSVGVMERSEELAKMYGADIEIAKKIGIAHDVAKEISEEDKLKYVEDNNIEIDEVERKNTTLLHAKIGKDIDEAVLYILDKKIELQVKKGALIHLNGIIARNFLLNNKEWST